jgi:hypothetical protein
MYYRVLEPLLDLTMVLCSHEENRLALSHAGLAAVLDLGAKLNKKKAGITSKVAAISQYL